MLGLPKATEMNRPLPKKAIFDKFKPNAADRQQFDTDIRRLAIVGEISTTTTNIAEGDTVKSFYVVLVNLRTAACDKKNLRLLSRLIEQNMLFVLEHDSMARLAVFRAGMVVESGEKPLNDWRISLTGLNFDSVWDNIIIQIGGVTVAEGNTLDEQLAADEECAKLNRRIDQLEKQARSEKQPRRKWELAEEVKKLKTAMKSFDFCNSGGETNAC
ncbi:hypothetical protein FACS1894142_1280 [Spirochaetia bacterium]|nr:hypothetical protein FACS1894142_1280 [Spirochaetia bacterium]